MQKNIAAVLFAMFVCLLLTYGETWSGEPERRVMDFVAVMDLKCGAGLEKDQCAALSDIVIQELVEIGKYRVIDRANRDKILGEVGFQQTGCVEGGCTVEAGRMLGVGKIVVGSVTKLGRTYLVNLQLVNVETAEVEKGIDEKCKNCEIDDLIDMVKSASRSLMGIESDAESEPADKPTKNDPPPPPTTGAGARKILSVDLVRSECDTALLEINFDGPVKYHELTDHPNKITLVFENAAWDGGRKTIRGSNYVKEVRYRYHPEDNSVWVVMELSPKVKKEYRIYRHVARPEIYIQTIFPGC